MPDVSDIPARHFIWNNKKVQRDDNEHIGYYAQDIEKVAPYLIHEN